VAVIGAGIAGSALAVALTGKGLRIALVEAQSLAPPVLPPAFGLEHFDARVSAITPRSKSFLAELGAWDAIADYRQCAYRHMTVWDADGTGVIEFDCAEVGAAALGHIVENRTIVSALLSRVAVADDIRAFGDASLQDCIRLEGDGTTRVQLADGVTLVADLLVAADGAQSRVREMMDFTTREWDYGHRAIVTTVEVEHSHQDTCWQRFLASGPLAFLPLPGADGRHYCSIVWSLQEDLVDDLLALDDAAFCVALSAPSRAALVMSWLVQGVPRFRCASAMRLTMYRPVLPWWPMPPIPYTRWPARGLTWACRMWRYWRGRYWLAIPSEAVRASWRSSSATSASARAKTW
jgi:2-octaprenylphenol hydroxylase